MERLKLLRSGWLVAVATLLMISLAPSGAQAQIDAGNIAGIATDETGGALPGVSITARNLANGQMRTVVTNAEGRYQVAAVPPGKYSVTAELSGFANVVRPEISVNVGSTVDVNIQMGLATVTETVTVTGAAPLVESTKTSLSAVVTLEVLEALPTRNRDYLGLTLLMPATGEATVNGENGSGFAVGGAKGHEGALLVDGFYNLDINFIQPKQRHSQDLVQEFQVITFGGSAEYGRAIGGIVNVVTKSGGNDFRGSTYAFLRDARINAQDFSQKASGLSKAPYDRLQWGGTFGGPVQRDKSFFIGSFEKLNENLPTSTAISADTIAAIGLSPTAALMPRGMDSKFVFGKYDHNISKNQRLQFSFSFTRQLETTSWSFTQTTRSRWFQLHPDDYALAGKWQRNANNSMYFVRNGDVKQYRGDKMPVAIYMNMHEFKTTEIEIQKGDRFYLMTDGFEDQFGGPNGKKFMSRQLVTLIKDFSGVPIKEQKTLFKNQFEVWKSDIEQVDDVLLMGFEI